MTDILGIGSSGLTAYRKLLETTGNNIANANTEGYVRRDVVLASVGEAQMLPTAKITASGSGVAIDLVRRASDAFLQSQVRTAMAREARAQILSEGLVRIEKSIVAPEHTIGTTVEDFFAKMQDLTLSPSSASMRLTMIDAGQRVAERFRVTGTSIKAEVTSAEAAIETTIAGINTITKQLASINREISRSGMGPQKLNDLLDQRDKLLKDISKLVSVTVVEKNSGEVAIFLGDSPSGPQLVKFDESKDIGFAVDGDNINYIYDPYGIGSATNQVLSGALAGQADFRSEALRLLASIDQLAVGLASAINNQHTQGIDLKGLQGKKLFSTDSIFAGPAALNRGSSRVDVSINAAADLVSSKYTIRFNKEDNAWTVRSNETGASEKGLGPLQLEGLTFQFEGVPADGDVFIAEPLVNAAIGMKFLTTDPTEIAASMPLYVDPDVKNTASGQLNLKKWDTPILPPSSPPVMTSLFGPQFGDTLAFRADGNAFYVPSGTKDAVVSSIGTLSAGHFSPENFSIAAGNNTGTAKLKVTSRAENKVPEATYTASYDELNAEWIVTSVQTGQSARGTTFITLDGNDFSFSGAGKNNDSFRVDSFLAASKRLKTNIELKINISTPNVASQDITLALQGNTSDLKEIVSSINEALAKSGHAESVFASSSNGTLTVNGLRAKNTATQVFDHVRVNSVVLLGNDANGELISSEALIEKPQDAADLKVLTMEKRELFSADMAGWRGISMDRSTKPLQIEPFDGLPNSVMISAKGEPLRDAFLRAGDGSLTAGGVYALDIVGMKSIRLAGDAIVGKDESGIVDALYQEIQDQSPSRAWIGSSIDFSLLKEEYRFTISVDGIDNYVTFRHAKDDKGQLLSTGSFEVDGPSPLTIAVKFDETISKMGRVVVTLPKTVSSTIPNVSISNGSFLGLSDNPSSRLIGAELDLNNIVSKLPLELRVALGDPSTAVPKVITIAQIPGNDASGLRWKMINGNLVFEADDARIRIIPKTAAQRENAFKLGFFGTDLNVSVIENKNGFKELKLVTSVDGGAQFANAEASVSRIGSTVRFFERLPEDLLIAVDAKTGSSARSVSTRFPDPTERQEPILGNITVKINDNAKLSIIDSKSGKTVALRDYVIGEPIHYLGLTFTLQSPLKSGDLYNIKWDGSRTGDNRNIVALTQLQNSDMFGYRRGSFQDIYASTSAKLGNTSQSATTDMDIAGKAASDLQSAYDSKTGVSLDKEASDLIRYQQAYQAAAQVVMAARTMFDTILKVS